MLGAGATNAMMDLEHLAAGAVLQHAGCGDRGEKFARGMVGGLGAIYLLARAVAVLVPAARV